MNMPNDLRASQRIPIENRVKVVSKGKMASYALAINISMGGLLLSAAPNLPVGSSCRLAILPSGHEDGKKVVVEGTVVRSDEHGTAVQFSRSLEKKTYEAFSSKGNAVTTPSFMNSYRSYFRISQDKNHEGCQEQLGVSAKTFRTVVLTSFCTCIPLAILPVWALRESIPSAPNWIKIATSFAYAGLWLGIIQPSVDLTVFRILKWKSNS